MDQQAARHVAPAQAGERAERQGARTQAVGAAQEGGQVRHPGAEPPPKGLVACHAAVQPAPGARPGLRRLALPGGPLGLRRIVQQAVAEVGKAGRVGPGVGQGAMGEVHGACVGPDGVQPACHRALMGLGPTVQPGPRLRLPGPQPVRRGHAEQAIGQQRGERFQLLLQLREGRLRRGRGRARGLEQGHVRHHPGLRAGQGPVQQHALQLFARGDDPQQHRRLSRHHVAGLLRPCALQGQARGQCLGVSAQAEEPAQWFGPLLRRTTAGQAVEQPRREHWPPTLDGRRRANDQGQGPRQGKRVGGRGGGHRRGVGSTLRGRARQLRLELCDALLQAIDRRQSRGGGARHAVTQELQPLVHALAARGRQLDHANLRIDPAGVGRGRPPRRNPGAAAGRSC